MGLGFVKWLIIYSYHRGPYIVTLKQKMNNGRSGEIHVMLMCTPWVVEGGTKSPRTSQCKQVRDIDLNRTKSHGDCISTYLPDLNLTTGERFWARPHHLVTAAFSHSSLLCEETTRDCEPWAELKRQQSWNRQQV